MIAFKSKFFFLYHGVEVNYYNAHSVRSTKRHDPNWRSLHLETNTDFLKFWAPLMKWFGSVLLSVKSLKYSHPIPTAAI